MARCRELHVQAYLGNADGEQPHVALQKCLHPELFGGVLSRRHFYYLGRGSAGLKQDSDEPQNVLDIIDNHCSAVPNSDLHGEHVAEYNRII